MSSVFDGCIFKVPHPFRSSRRVGIPAAKEDLRHKKETFIRRSSNPMFPTFRTSRQVGIQPGDSVPLSVSYCFCFYLTVFPVLTRFLYVLFGFLFVFLCKILFPVSIFFPPGRTRTSGPCRPRLIQVVLNQDTQNHSKNSTTPLGSSHRVSPLYVLRKT